MLFLPLIQRELKVRARRGANYWGRFAAGLVALMTCLPPLLMSDLSAAGKTVGATVFNMLVGIAFALCCMACVLTADAISSEKRDGTLGLLFQTRVKSDDLIASKLASSGIASLGSLLALVPFLTLPMIFGGVTPGETVRKVFALIISLFLTLCLGIYASSSGSNRLKVVRKAIFWLLGIVLVPFLAREFWPFNSIGPREVGAFSPLVALLEAGDNLYRGPGRSWLPYWLSVVAMAVMAWIFLRKAGRNMERLVREEERLPSRSRPSPALLLRSVSSFRSGWSALAAPVEWLVQRQRGLNAILWAGVLAGVFYYVFFRAFFTWRTAGIGNGLWLVYWIPNIVFGCISGAFFAWAASRFFVETRKNGELELLLTTPVGAATIVQDQWKVLMTALPLPLAIAVLGLLLPFGYTMLTLFERSGGNEIFFPYSMSMLLGAANLVVGTLALCRVGLWFGLRAPGQGTAILWTLAVAKGIPYFLSFAWSLLSNYLGAGPYSITSPLYIVSLVPSLITLGFCLWLMRHAKVCVTRDLTKGDAQSLSFPFADRAWRELTTAAGRLRSLSAS